MPFRDDRETMDREILDIIPERFDPDPDSHYARKGAHTRVILTVALALLAVAALGVAARHILFGEAPKTQTAGVPEIKADDRPIKTKPDDRGGMDVPNQDKLVYERMGTAGGDASQTERLLPPPEQPQEPPAQPRRPSIKPAFPTPPAAAAKPAAAEPAVELPAAPETPTAPVAPAAQAPAKGAARGAANAAPAAGKPQQLAAAAPAKPPAAPAKSAAAQPAAATTAAAPPPAAAAQGGWLVQLGALKSEADAKAEWNRVRNANKDVLGDLGSNIVRVDLGEKGVFWRLRAGPMDEGQARSVCSNLAKRSQGCILAKK